MMGLVTLLKAKSGFEEYTIAQLQAMIHDLAIQEVRGSSKVCTLSCMFGVVQVLISLFRNTIGIFGRKKTLVEQMMMNVL